MASVRTSKTGERASGKVPSVPPLETVRTVDQLSRARPRSEGPEAHSPTLVEVDSIDARIHEGLTNPATGEVIQTLENINSFMDAYKQLDVPEDTCFTLSDFELDGWDERPQVTECLLTLKTYQENPAAFLRPFNNGDTAVVNGSLRSAATTNGVQSAVGVTRLMQQCTVMLREKMWTDQRRALAPSSQPKYHRDKSAAPDSALEAMGPVLESVLGSLTQEYEKRLLAKDHEVKAAHESVTALQSRLRFLEAELSETRRLLADPPRKALPAPTTKDLEELEELRKTEKSLRQQAEQTAAQFSNLIEEKDMVEQEKAELEHGLVEAHSQLQELQGVAHNYRAMQQENRKLYNMVQDLRGNIRVFCRVRPLGTTGDPSHSCVDIGMNGEMALYNPNGVRKVFFFDRVFVSDSTQEEVYMETQPLIRSVLDGYNVCIFAYGQTGSGKTHTMTGTDVTTPDGRGINYRALDDLFTIQQQRKDEISYSIRVQMLEIYNEALRDLLAPAEVVKKQRLEIQNTQRSGVNVPEAHHAVVENTEDVIEVMSTGARNRVTGCTKMNDRSSRSHQVLTVIVDGQSLITGVKTHGCLHLIDLAGSERLSRSEAQGERLEEAKHINKSLSALGDVMAALAGSSSHVPFRNSKLTQLLQDSLAGQAKVMMFLHTSPESSSYGESVSSLSFGQRVSSITLGQAKQNMESMDLFRAREAAQKLEAAKGQLGEEAQRLREQLQDELSQRRAVEEEKQQLQAEVSRLKAMAAARSSSCATPTADIDLVPPRQRVVPLDLRRVESVSESPRASRLWSGASSGQLSHRHGADSGSTSGMTTPTPTRPSSRSGTASGAGAGHSSSRLPRPTSARSNSSDRPRSSGRRPSASNPGRALPAAPAARIHRARRRSWKPGFFRCCMCQSRALVRGSASARRSRRTRI